jgi:hypothetical protein
VAVGKYCYLRLLSYTDAAAAVAAAVAAGCCWVEWARGKHIEQNRQAGYWTELQTCCSYNTPTMLLLCCCGWLLLGECARRQKTQRAEQEGCSWWIELQICCCYNTLTLLLLLLLLLAAAG